MLNKAIQVAGGILIRGVFLGVEMMIASQVGKALQSSLNKITGKQNDTE